MDDDGPWVRPRARAWGNEAQRAVLHAIAEDLAKRTAPQGGGDRGAALRRQPGVRRDRRRRRRPRPDARPGLAPRPRPHPQARRGAGRLEPHPERAARRRDPRVARRVRPPARRAGLWPARRLGPRRPDGAAAGERGRRAARAALPRRAVVRAATHAGGRGGDQRRGRGAVRGGDQHRRARALRRAGADGHPGAAAIESVRPGLGVAGPVEGAVARHGRGDGRRDRRRDRGGVARSPASRRTGAT